MDKRLMMFGETDRRDTVPRVMFVDPGLGGTGWAFFACISRGQGAQPPVATGVIRGGEKEGWQSQCHSIGAMLCAQCLAGKIQTVVLEMPELWTSATSHASATHKARAGEPADLFKLTYLVGVLAASVVSYVGLPVLIAPQTWKGQLPKEVVHERIKKALGIKYKEHEADAVGMGLAAQGQLDG
jgi:Holliday junction resolvasome RuvABC endonuclease subunit